jgi:AraC family transcriptional regulator
VAIGESGNWWYKSAVPSPDPAAPTWLMSLRAHPEVQVIGKAVHGLDSRSLTLSWHTMLWLLVLADYEAEFVIDEHVVPVRPGTLTIFPPGAACSARFIGRSEQIQAFFQLAAGRGDEVPIPCLTDLGTEADRVQSQFEVALAAFPTDPARTARIIHEILYELSRQAPPQPITSLHPAVRAAVAYIESNLHQQIDVKAIAAHAGLSERQLRTQFRRQFDMTVVGYVRRRRAERARKLLLATELPAKTVAAQIGILDLQRFNKLIRHEYGVSPLELRASRVR